MSKLILLRHLKSQWNVENRFAGWTDGPLSREGKEEAKDIGAKIFQVQIDKIYTSSLFRNMDTVSRVFEHDGNKYPFFIHIDGGKMQKWGNFDDLSQNDVPTFVTEALNERYYGQLQGQNKDVAIQKYGKEQVHLWRRSYDVAPPGGESEKEVFKRTTPFYQKYVEKNLKDGQNVLIVASHNPLRAIVKYVEKISDEDIINFEIPYGGLMMYDFDEKNSLENKRNL